jgi:UDP-N-acetylglucosamine--N-acetylmuramyl-(pentapeptide) pyrophosphoryl-undecaprenol N-acetylglucosamine transferase
MQKHNLKILISGGGTGGHIFPAIAIANGIRELHPNAEILFVGAIGKMEMEKVPMAGYKIKGLNITGFQRSLSLKNLSFPFKLIKSMIAARQIVKQFKPDLVIGTGGFASGPTLRAASKKGIPCLIQEQNSFPGVTNRLLSKAVQKICVAYEGMEVYFPKEKITFTGNPVRKDLLNIQTKKTQAQGFFKLDPKKTTVFIVGGSQGARGINLAINNNLDALIKNQIQVVWQTGKFFIDEAKQNIKNKGAKLIQAHAFIKEMDLAYAAADIIISRAGAIAISELCIVGKACIFVPFPAAAADHQTKNAMALVKKNAAIMIGNEAADKELLPQLLEIINNKETQIKLSENLKKLARPEATQKIVNEALNLIN